MNLKDTKFLNGLRIILALWVGLGHFYQHIGAELFLKFPFWYILKYAGPAVDGFMLITGFLMMYHYDQATNNSYTVYSKSTTFYLKRFFRLYPLYFVVVLIGYLSFPIVNDLSIKMHHHFLGTEDQLLSFTYGPGKNVNFWDLLTHLTFIHGLLPQYNATIIGPAWSLSTEIQFYLIFPFLMMFLYKTRNFVTLILISVCAYWISNKLLGIWETPGKLMTFGAPSTIFQKMIYFNMGIVLAQYKLNRSRINLVFLNLIVLSIFSETPISTMVCLFISTLFLSGELEPYLPSPLNYAIKLTKKILSLRGTGFGANISYSFYLIHSMLIPVSFGLGTKIASVDQTYFIPVIFLIFITSSISISYIFFLLVEKPFMKIGQQIIKRNSVIP